MPRLVGITGGVVQRVAAGAVISQAAIDHFTGQYASVVTVPDASAGLRIAEGEAWDGTQSVATPATVAAEAAEADERTRTAAGRALLPAIRDIADGTSALTAAQRERALARAVLFLLHKDRNPSL